MNYNEIIHKVAKDNNLSIELVDKTYKAFWLFIKETIKKLPLKEDLTEEEFNKLRTNFNIPSIGKLSCTYRRYLGVKEKFKHIQKLKNERAN